MSICMSWSTNLFSYNRDQLSKTLAIHIHVPMYQNLSLNNYLDNSIRILYYCTVTAIIYDSFTWTKMRQIYYNDVIMSPMASQITPTRLFTQAFRHRSKKTSKLRVTGLCTGNSPVTGEFPAQRPATRKIFPFDDVIMVCYVLRGRFCWWCPGLHDGGVGR